MSKSSSGINRATPKEAASFVDQYEAFEEQIAAEQSKFMTACKKIREDQKELLDDAKSQGVPKKVVKAIADARKFEAKARAKMEGLEEDDEAYAVDIRTALGDYADLPLGAAAVDRGDQTSGVVDAVKKSMSADEWGKAGERVREAAQSH